MSALCYWYIQTNKGCMNDTTKKMDCKRCENFASKYNCKETEKIVKFRARVQGREKKICLEKQ